MKYFTKQLWIDLQQPGELGREASGRWDEAFEAYARELESLRDRLAPEAFEFFRTADVHDGSLIHLGLKDFDPSAPIPPDASTDADAADDGPFEGPYRLIVEMSVSANDTEWTLRYSGLRRVLVDYPSEEPLFFYPGSGFEDWGYHELSDAGHGFLRHEVLFSSGSVVLIEFRDVSVARVDGKSCADRHDRE